jgi:hypothetical protein
VKFNVYNSVIDCALRMHMPFLANILRSIKKCRNQSQRAYDLLIDPLRNGTKSKSVQLSNFLAIASFFRAPI